MELSNQKIELRQDPSKEISNEIEQEITLAESSAHLEVRSLKTQKEKLPSYSYENKHKDKLTSLKFSYLTSLNLLRFASYRLTFDLLFDKNTLDTGYMTDESVRIPIPTDLVNLLEDLVNGTAESTKSLFSTIQRDLKENHSDTKQILKNLDDLKLLFGLVKRSYGDNTLNYEIYEDIEKQLVNLTNKINEKNFHEAMQLSDEIMTIFQTIVDMNKELKNAGAKLLTVESTGEKIGEMRIFRTKTD